jgi:hypothetical protein
VKPFRLDRRTLLRGAGGIAVGLPFLEIMSRSRRAGAQLQAPPKRFVVFFSPDGSIRENWTPTGTETNFQLSRILAPLEMHKQHIVILDGVDNVCAHAGLGDDHMRGMGSMLTGIELLPARKGAGDPAGSPGYSVDRDRERDRQGHGSNPRARRHLGKRRRRLVLHGLRGRQLAAAARQQSGVGV